MQHVSWSTNRNAFKLIQIMNIIKTMHLYIAWQVYTGGTHKHICMYIYIYAITCIHWYFDSYVNVTEKVRVHIDLVSKVVIFNISFFNITYHTLYNSITKWKCILNNIQCQKYHCTYLLRSFVVNCNWSVPNWIALASNKASPKWQIMNPKTIGVCIC